MEHLFPVKIEKRIVIDKHAESKRIEGMYQEQYLDSVRPVRELMQAILKWLSSDLLPKTLENKMIFREQVARVKSLFTLCEKPISVLQSMGHINTCSQQLIGSYGVYCQEIDALCTMANSDDWTDIIMIDKSGIA
uniref:Uncharacterized protein n=1 Tax=Bracon brevicornis TaxID=1563983 RepID=A0A6V7K409_9HYME